MNSTLLIITSLVIVGGAVALSKWIEYKIEKLKIEKDGRNKKTKNKQ